MMNRKVVLSIAGSDCSGGAGIQADLKTMMAHGIYGMSAITAVTVQNTLGVSSVLPVPAEVVYQQIIACCSDILPDCIKIGMIPDAQVVEAVADALSQYKNIPIIVDPVMVSTSGKRLLSKEAELSFEKKLLPRAFLITPNLPEAEVLGKREIVGDTKEALESIASEIAGKYQSNVLLKGGHLQSRADDLLVDTQEGAHWYEGTKLCVSNTHGTGCTLSTAIACEIAMGAELTEAVKKAKAYLRGALASGLNLGQGNGPVDHGWNTRVS